MVDLTSTSSSWLCDFVMGNLDLYLSDYDTRRSFFRRRGVDYHNYSTWSKNPISDFKNSTVSISTQVTSTTAVKARVCVCMQMCVCGSELICLLQSPLSPVQRCLIYALVPLILWLALKWHHPSALTPACSPLTLPFPDDTFHPRHDLSGPWAADKSASARVQSQR